MTPNLPFCTSSSSEIAFMSHSETGKAWQKGVMNEQDDLHLYLLEWRKLRGMTQRELSELTGFDTGYISKVERGQRDGLSRDFLVKTAKALKCRAKDLFEDPNGDLDLDLLAIVKMWTAMPTTSRRAAHAMIKGLADVDDRDDYTVDKEETDAA